MRDELRLLEKAPGRPSLRAVGVANSAPERIELMPLARVLPNPLNPRGSLVPASLDDLSASIIEHGVLTPLLVVPAGDVVHIVAGHRRRAAAAMAGLRELPVISHAFTTRQQLEIMLVENLQRADLTPLQEARGYLALVNDGLRQAEVARRLGVPAVRVSLRLELLRLDEQVQRLFDDGSLPMGLVRALSSIPDAREQRRLSALALQRRLSVSELCDYVRRSHAQPPPAPPARSLASRVVSLPGARTDEEPRTRTAAAASPTAPAPVPSGPLTKSEAAVLIGGEGAATFAMLRSAMSEACDGCDEERYPEICRACPLPQFVAAVVREVRRAG